MGRVKESEYTKYTQEERKRVSEKIISLKKKGIISAKSIYENINLSAKTYVLRLESCRFTDSDINNLKRLFFWD